MLVHFAFHKLVNDKINKLIWDTKINALLLQRLCRDMQCSCIMRYISLSVAKAYDEFNRSGEKEQSFWRVLEVFGIQKVVQTKKMLTSA